MDVVRSIVMVSVAGATAVVLAMAVVRTMAIVDIDSASPIRVIPVVDVMTVAVTITAIAVIAMLNRTTGWWSCLADRDNYQLQQDDYHNHSYYFLHGSSLLTIRFQ